MLGAAGVNRAGNRLDLVLFGYLTTRHEWTSVGCQRPADTFKVRRSRDDSRTRTASGTRSTRSCSCAFAGRTNPGPAAGSVGASTDPGARTGDSGTGSAISESRSRLAGSH